MRKFLHILLSVGLIYLTYIVYKYAQTQEAFAGLISSSTIQTNKTLTNAALVPTIQTTQETASTSLYFVGDMMFDRAVRKAVDTKGFDAVFGDSPKLFSGHDLVIGNLEGPITTFPSKTLFADGSMGHELVFTFPPSTAAALKNAGIGMVTLANNHEQNFGRQGITQTKSFLSAQGVGYFGDPENAVDVSTSTCITNISKKTCIGFVGFHEFSYKNKEIIAKAIKDLRPTVDFLVVFPHWGVEYNKKFTPSQQTLAHSWIDLGADVIIGAHPHVIEPIEIYKGKPIFYSLGNYIFDQFFSFDTTHGLTVGISLSASSTTYTLVPIQNTGIVVKKPDATTTATILAALASSSVSTVGNILAGEIEGGSFTVVH